MNFEIVLNESFHLIRIDRLEDHPGCKYFDNRSSDEFIMDYNVDTSPKYPENHDDPLYAAAFSGEQEVVQLLLESGADINAKESLEGKTVLWAAASRGHLATVQLLVERGCDVNMTNGSTGSTPFRGACLSGKTGISS
jgi:ankyrin repeat protein